MYLKKTTYFLKQCFYSSCKINRANHFNVEYILCTLSKVKTMEESLKRVKQELEVNFNYENEKVSDTDTDGIVKLAFEV